jgi:hypothetical protein
VRRHRDESIARAARRPEQSVRYRDTRELSSNRALGAVGTLRVTATGVAGGRAATHETTSSRVSACVDSSAEKAITTDKGIKDPKSFDGKEGTFQPWLDQMGMKLVTSKFKTEADGMRYVHDFTEGSVWAALRPRIPPLFGPMCPDPYSTIEEMMTHLSERYGEDNTADKAMTAMGKLTQGTKEDFNAFYAKYQGYQAYCPLLPVQERHRLQGKLNKTFTDKVEDGTEYASERELATRCSRLQAQIGTSSSTTTSDTNNGGRRGRNRGGRDGTGNGGSGGGGGSGSRSGNIPNSELPTKYRNLPALTQEMRDTLMKANKCFKCRELGHGQRDRAKCPVAIAEDAYKKKESLKPNHTDVAAEDEPPGNGSTIR